MTSLVHDLVDIVSKNGNLLLNVGPRADGMIPDEPVGLLRGLGKLPHLSLRGVLLAPKQSPTQPRGWLGHQNGTAHYALAMTILQQYPSSAWHLDSPLSAD